MARRLSLSLILCVLTATAITAAPAPVYREPPKPKLPDVYAAMQGTWEIDQNVNNGFRGGNRINRASQKIRIQGGTWAYIYNNNGIETESTKAKSGLPRNKW